MSSRSRTIMVRGLGQTSLRPPQLPKPPLIDHQGTLRQFKAVFIKYAKRTRTESWAQQGKGERVLAGFHQLNGFIKKFSGRVALDLVKHWFRIYKLGTIQGQSMVVFLENMN